MKLFIIILLFQIIHFIKLGPKRSKIENCSKFVRRVELAIIKIKFYETLKYYNYIFFNAYHLLYLDKYKDYSTDNLVSLAKRILFTIIKILKRKKVKEKYSEVMILKLISYKLFTYLFIY